MNSSIWQDFLTIISQEINSRVVETWFKVLSFKEWDSASGTVYLVAPNLFIKDWVIKHYMQTLQTHLGRLLHVEKPTIQFVQSTQDSIKPEVPNNIVTLLPARASEKTNSIRINTNTQQLNPSYNFENFIVGPSNSLAFAAARAIIDKLGTLYNPLFIYGGSGLGKTHLLHAIAQQAQLHNPKLTILYQSADRFVQEFIDAIRFDRVHKFQAKYKYIDLLLVDDLQFIANKEQTQEAFFHIFNSLYESHKQIVFSSDAFPQNMNGIAQRLRSRIAGGLITDIHEPSIETKIAILKIKAKLHLELINDQVLEYIANQKISNIRELEGALIRVIAFATLSKEPITVELAQRVIVRVIVPVTSRTIDFNKIVNVVSKYFSYSINDLRSKSRNKELVQVRQIAMFMMKKCTDKSLRDIGEFLGGRDHSTVLHGVEKINKNLTHKVELANKLFTIEQEILR